MRSNTLHLLSDQIVGSSAAQHDVLKACLQGEAVALDAQSARERVLRLRKVGQVLRHGDGIAAGIGARWLVGECHCRLTMCDIVKLLC